MIKPVRLSPCKSCPFRKDVPAYLNKRRVAEIATMLLGGNTFPCHKTLDYNTDTERPRVLAGTQMCAGAAILLHRIDTPNQYMQLAERLTDFRREQLDLNAPVFDTFADMEAAQIDN